MAWMMRSESSDGFMFSPLHEEEDGDGGCCRDGGDEVCGGGSCGFTGFASVAEPTGLSEHELRVVASRTHVASP